MLARRPSPVLPRRTGRPHLVAVGPVEERTSVQLVIPVHNEVGTLERSVTAVRRHLDAGFPFPAIITIADNASTDGTWEVARRLARTVAGVEAIRIDAKGRGLALRTAWSGSPASVLAYMDVDLSTDLAALLPLVAAVASGHSDIAIGSRLAPGSAVHRGVFREVVSRSYNLVLRAAAGRRFTDAQCGFKAVSAEAAELLLPSVRDGGWFFDTELLLAASSAGMRIHEVPVDWVDDPDSRVRVASTAWNDLRGLVRVAHRQMLRRLIGAGAGVAAAAGLASALAPLTGGLAAVVVVAAAVLTALWAGPRIGRVRRRAAAPGGRPDVAPVNLVVVPPPAATARRPARR